MGVVDSRECDADRVSKQHGQGDRTGRRGWSPASAGARRSRGDDNPWRDAGAIVAGCDEWGAVRSIGGGEFFDGARQSFPWRDAGNGFSSRWAAKGAARHAGGDAAGHAGAGDCAAIESIRSARDVPCGRDRAFRSVNGAAAWSADGDFGDVHASGGAAFGFAAVPGRGAGESDFAVADFFVAWGSESAARSWHTAGALVKTASSVAKYEPIRK